MYPKDVAELAKGLLKEDLKTLLVALLISQAGTNVLFWVDGTKEALNEKKGDSE